MNLVEQVGLFILEQVKQLYYLLFIYTKIRKLCYNLIDLQTLSYLGGGHG